MKKLSVILLGTLLCVCIALLPMEAQAAEKEGYLTYTITDGEVTITDCDEDAKGKIVIPDTIEGYPVTKIGEGAFWDCTGIKEIVVPDSITVIPNAAFRECETLEKITLPEGLTSIGNGAFYECEYLASIDIPESVTSIGGGAFRFCRKLSAITIPNGIQEIKDSTFASCNSLTDVTIPDSVTTIGAEAFSGCPLSSDFVLPKNISSIGDGAFGRGCGITIPKDHPYFTVDEYGVLFNRDKTRLVLALSPIKGKYEVPEGVQTIQGWAFGGCKAMTEIVFPNTVTEIGPYALCGIGAASVRLPEGLTTIEEGLLATCKNLISVYISDSVTRIERKAFEFNYDLRVIRFSDNLQYIGEWAFQNVYMQSVTLPDTLQEIAKGAFSTCSSLSNVYFYGTKEQWQSIKIGEHNQELLDATLRTQYTPSNPPKEGYLSYAIQSGKVTITGCDPYASGEIVIPDTIKGYPVTIIGQEAFANATDITKVTLPKNLKTIGSEAFRYSGVTQIVIPDSVTSLGFCAFDGCWRLKEVTVGVGITKIASQTFYGCEQLEKVMLHDGITEIGQNAFKECYALTSIDLPASLHTLGGSAFNRCTSLTSVVIPDGVTVISRFAFSNCNSLTELVLPRWLTVIEDYAFRGCKITKVQIPDLVTAIGEQAFGECSELTAITLPSVLTTIGPSAFEKCKSLTEVLYYSNEQQWDEIAIDNANNGNDALLNANRTYHTCTWNTSVVISEPTCQQEGAEELICTECGKATGKKIEVVSHAFVENCTGNKDGHWYQCKYCNKKGNWQNHIPGPAATEDAPQTCTVCGYEIAPKLQKEEPTYWIWIVVGAVLIAGGATVAVVILKKKRQQ